MQLQFNDLKNCIPIRLQFDELRNYISMQLLFNDLKNLYSPIGKFLIIPLTEIYDLRLKKFVFSYW